MLEDTPTKAIPIPATDAFPTTPGLTGVAAPAVLLPAVLALCAVALAALGATRSIVVVEPLRWLPAAVAGAAALATPHAYRVLIVRPVMRLRRAVRSAGRSVPVGLPRSRLREFDRIAGAFTPGTTRPARVPIVPVLLLLVALLVAALGAALASVVATAAPPVSAAVGDARRATAAAAGEVRHALQDGLAGIRSVAAAVTTSDPADLDTAVVKALAARSVFRSVHVVGPAGSAVARAGAEPRSTGPAPGPGVQEFVSTGPTPVVVAVAPLSVAGYSMVAEYDVRALNASLAATGMWTRVVDPELRSVLGNDGYLAFAPMTEPALTGVIDAAQQTGAHADSVGGTSSAIAAQSVGRADESAALGWVVVSRTGLSRAGLTTDPGARASIVVLSLAIAAVLLTAGWTWQTVLRPVRRLAGHAAAVRVALDVGRTIDLLAVQRLDELGAITAALNRVASRAGRDAAARTTVMRRVAGRRAAGTDAETLALPVMARLGRS